MIFPWHLCNTNRSRKCEKENLFHQIYKRDSKWSPHDSILHHRYRWHPFPALPPPPTTKGALSSIHWILQKLLQFNICLIRPEEPPCTLYLYLSALCVHQALGKWIRESMGSELIIWMAHTTCCYGNPDFFPVTWELSGLCNILLISSDILHLPLIFPIAPMPQIMTTTYQYPHMQTLWYEICKLPVCHFVS